MSNTGMQDTTDQRLTALEIKASFTEDLLEELNDVIIRQQRQIDALMAEIGDLRQILGDLSRLLEAICKHHQVDFQVHIDLTEADRQVDWSQVARKKVMMNRSAEADE